MIERILGVVVLILTYFAGKCTYNLYLGTQVANGVTHGFLGMDMTLIVIMCALLTVAAGLLGIKMLFHK